MNRSEGLNNSKFQIAIIFMLYAWELPKPVYCDSCERRGICHVWHSRLTLVPLFSNGGATVTLSFGRLAENTKNRVPRLYTLYLLHNKMCLQRRPLGDISANVEKRKELSLYIRGRIVGKHEEGAKATSISKDLQIPRSTVRYTIFQDPLRDEGYSKPRTGRPEKYSERFKRNLISFVRKEPKATMAKIRKHIGAKPRPAWASTKCSSAWSRPFPRRPATTKIRCKR